jgi:hypothetical protein
MSQGRYVSGELVRSVYVVNMSSGGGGGGAVDSVFGRTGAVTAASGDYEVFYVKKNTNGQTQTISGGGLLVTEGALNVTGIVTVGNDILPAISGGSNLGSATLPFGSGYFSSGSLFVGDAHVTATGDDLYLNGSIMATGASIAQGAVPPGNALRVPVWSTLNQPAAVNQGSAWLSQGNSLDATYPAIAYYAYDYEAVTGGPATSGSISYVSSNGNWGGIENNVGTYTLKVRAAWPFGVSDEEIINITINPFTLTRDTMFGDLDGLQAWIDPSSSANEAVDYIAFPGAIVLNDDGDYVLDVSGEFVAQSADYGFFYSASTDTVVSFRLANNGSVSGGARYWTNAPALVQGTTFGGGNGTVFSGSNNISVAQNTRIRGKILPLGAYYQAGLGSQHYLSLQETTSGTFADFGTRDTDWSYGFLMEDDWVCNGYLAQMLAPSGTRGVTGQFFANQIGGFSIGNDSPFEYYGYGNSQNGYFTSSDSWNASSRGYIIAESGSLVTVVYDGTATDTWKLYVDNTLLSSNTSMDTYMSTSPQAIANLHFGNFATQATITGYQANYQRPGAWPFRINSLFIANGTAFTSTQVADLVTNKTDLTGAANYGAIDVLGTFTSSGIDNTKGSTVTYERKDFSFS